MRLYLKDKLNQWAITLYDATRAAGEPCFTDLQFDAGEAQDVKQRYRKQTNGLLEALETIERMEDEIATLKSSAPKKRASRKKAG